MCSLLVSEVGAKIRFGKHGLRARAVVVVIALGRNGQVVAASRAVQES